MSFQERVGGDGRAHLHRIDHLRRHGLAVADRALNAIVVFDVLEERFFVKVHSLGRISRGVHEFLQQPWSAHADGRVLLDLENGQVAPFSESDARQGFLVDLTPIRERVDVFLGLVPEQREIPLSVGASGGD